MKKFFMCIIFAFLIIEMTSCGKTSDWIFSLNGEEIKEAETRAFGVIYVKEHSIANNEQLGELYDHKMTYQEYYKEQLSDSITQDLLLYSMAKKEHCKLSEDDKKQMEKNIQAIVEQYGESYFETEHIERADLEQAYEKKMLGEKYLKEQSEQGASIKDLENSDRERYIRVYQVTFPTVALDEEGMVVSKSDGTPKLISLEQRNAKEEEAKAFCEAAKQTTNLKQLLKDYDTTVTGMERTLNYKDLPDAYKKEVDRLRLNEVSNVITSDYGYYVIQMLCLDDEEYASKLEQHSEEATLVSQKRKIVEEFMDTYAKSVDTYRNKELWSQITFDRFFK